MKQHPSSPLVRKLIGLEISRVFIGPSGMHICFSKKTEKIEIYTIWVMCKIDAVLRSGQTISSWFPVPQEESRFIEILSQKLVLSCDVDPKDCSCQILLDDDSVISIFPSTKASERTWIVFDQTDFLEGSFSVNTDYFEGWWSAYAETARVHV
jgi:hypothetical protein